MIGLASDSSQSSCRSCFGFESVQLLSVLWTGASTVRGTASEPFHEDGLQRACHLLLRNKEVWEKLRITHLRVSNPEPWLGRRTPSWQSQPGDFRVVSATWKPSCCNGNREFLRCGSGVPRAGRVGSSLVLQTINFYELVRRKEHFSLLRVFVCVVSVGVFGSHNFLRVAPLT